MSSGIVVAGFALSPEEWDALDDEERGLFLAVLAENEEDERPYAEYLLRFEVAPGLYVTARE